MGQARAIGESNRQHFRVQSKKKECDVLSWFPQAHSHIVPVGVVCSPVKRNRVRRRIYPSARAVGASQQVNSWLDRFLLVILRLMLILTVRVVVVAV
jgi:dienelactone hydrolase